MSTLCAKSIVLAGLLVCFFILNTNCSKNPKDPTMSNGTESLGKVVSVGIAEKDLKPEFEKLARLLSQRASKVIGKIMAKDKMGTDRTELSFAHLNLDADLPRSFTTPDGRILETTLERAQPCHVMPSTSTSAIIFAPDPDRFLRDDEAYIVKGLFVDRGSLTPISFTLDEYVDRFSNVPFYLVGYQDRTPIAQSNSLQKMAASLYLACHKIHMKKDLDSGSSEECQVFTLPPGGSRYNKSTGLIFSGNERYDAANRYVYFPDVNTTSSIYTATQIPAFFPLQAQAQGWVAIEDDDTQGTHNRAWFLPGPPTCTYCDLIFSAAVTVCSPNWSVVSTVREFWCWYSGPINSDDVWQDGCYEGFNTSWDAVQHPNLDYKYSLYGNEFWVQAKLY